MLTFINICAVIPLGIIVIQDLRYRYISWFLIPLLLVVFAGRGLFTLLPSQFVYFSLINLAFITIQLLVLTLYMGVKNKKLTLIANNNERVFKQYVKGMEEDLPLPFDRTLIFVGRIILFVISILFPHKIKSKTIIVHPILSKENL